jgi:hypothetical protein
MFRPNPSPSFFLNRQIRPRRKKCEFSLITMRLMRLISLTKGLISQ